MADSGFSNNLTNINYDDIVDNFNCQDTNEQGKWNVSLATQPPDSVANKFHGNLGLSYIKANGKSIYGVAPKCKIRLLRVSDDWLSFTNEYMQRMLDYIKTYANEIDVVALPTNYHCYSESGKFAVLTQEAISTSLYSENGVFLVGCSGNDGERVIDDGFNFGCVYGAILVGGGTRQDKGMQSWAPYKKGMDLTMYGYQIKGEKTANSFTTMNGTSMSCHLLSGCAALVKIMLTKKYRRTPTNIEIYDFILKHTEGTGSNNIYLVGNGIFNFMAYNNKVHMAPKIHGMEWEE